MISGAPLSQNQDENQPKNRHKIHSKSTQIKINEKSVQINRKINENQRAKTDQQYSTRNPRTPTKSAEINTKSTQNQHEINVLHVYTNRKPTY